MKQERIAILTDLDPMSNAGANLVGFQYAMAAQRDFEIEFWTSVCVDADLKPQNSYENIKIRRFLHSKRFGDFPKKGIKAKTIRELFSPFPIIWITQQIKRFKPQLIWVHQIGNVFPLTSFLVCRILKIPALFTLHDFGVLVPRKLFPKDLNLENVDLSPFALGVNFPPVKLRLQNGSHSKFYLFRYSIIRLILSSVYLISISSLQHQILTANKLNLFAKIENGVGRCNCDAEQITRLDAILFAGRLNGKGLEHAVETVAKSKGLRLHLAGGQELFEIAKRKIESERITYHGQLSHAEVCQLLHQVKFTSVMSDCFDVYPSILLEALAHGSAPISYPTVGNANLAHEIDRSLVVKFGETIDDVNLDRLNSDAKLSSKVFEVGKTLKSFDKASEEYYGLIKRILKSKEQNF